MSTPVETLAEEMLKSFDNLKAINDSKLTTRALAILVRDQMPSRVKVKLTDIELTINILAKLGDVYVKK